MMHRRMKIGVAVAGLLLLFAGLMYANRGTLAAWGFDKLLSGELEKKMADSYEPLPNHPAPSSLAVKDGKTKQDTRNKPFSVLLMGVDARANERGRSDTLIYTVVRPEDGRVLMISIPRDTYAELVGKGTKDKITHAYVYGGPEMTVASVEKLLGTKVDHYASINFQGFIQVVDELGGIPLPITKDIVNRQEDHEKFTIKANQPSYNGVDALNFVRYREDAGGDISRTERNRQFLEALIRKTAALQQWHKIPTIVDTLGDHLRTDIRPESITDLIKRFLQTDHEISSYTLQGEGKRMGPDNLWYFEADAADLRAVKQLIATWLNPAADKMKLSVPVTGKQTY